VADWHNNPDSYRRVAGYYLTKGDQLVDRGPDGPSSSSPGSLRAYRRSLALFLHARSIVQASFEWEVAHRRRDEITPQQDGAKVADLERSIAGVELRLGDVAEAIERASTAQRLDPASAESYRQLSAAYLVSGRADDAAVALVEGSLVTSNQELRQEVLDLYRRGLDTQGCATIPGPYGLAVNPSCAMVRKHLCLAAAQTLQLYRQMGRDDLLEKTKAEVAPLGCL
jgi:tetratricopeptide (TPR) repeat protein